MKEETFDYIIRAYYDSLVDTLNFLGLSQETRIKAQEFYMNRLVKHLSHSFETPELRDTFIKNTKAFIDKAYGKGRESKNEN